MIDSLNKLFTNDTNRYSFKSNIFRSIIKKA